jgi:hypothetical protein
MKRQGITNPTKQGTRKYKEREKWGRYQLYSSTMARSKNLCMGHIMTHLVNSACRVSSSLIVARLQGISSSDQSRRRV